jgi:hypothetical protein
LQAWICCRASYSSYSLNLLAYELQDQQLSAGCSLLLLHELVGKTECNCKSDSTYFALSTWLPYSYILWDHPPVLVWQLLYTFLIEGLVS